MRFFDRKGYRVLAFLYFVCLTALAQAEAAGKSNTTNLPFWKISKGDSSVHLLGTIHILNGQVPWYTAPLREALSEADSLVLELAPDQMAPAVMQNVVQKYGLLAGDVKLADTIPPQTYQRLQKLLQESGSPPQVLDTMQPWLASIVLTVQVAAAHGFLPQYGVDQALMLQASAMGKPVKGLESAEQQMQVLASIGKNQAALMLDLTIDQLGDIVPLFEKMRDAWLQGDLAALDRLMKESIGPFPEVVESLLYQRNRNWLPEIEKLLSAPGKHFIAVGAAHLVGENSVIELLGKKGYKIERIAHTD